MVLPSRPGRTLPVARAGNSRARAGRSRLPGPRPEAPACRRGSTGDGSSWPNGNPPLALVPCHPDRCPAELARGLDDPALGKLERTGHPGPGRGTTERVIRRILTLLSFALRVEPRMIRAVRRLLPDGRRDAGIESLVWQDEACSASRSRGGRLRSRQGERAPRNVSARSIASIASAGLRPGRADAPGHYPGGSGTPSCWVWNSEVRQRSRSDRSTVRAGPADWFRGVARSASRRSPEIRISPATTPTWFRQVILRRMLPGTSDRRHARATHCTRIWSRVTLRHDRDEPLPPGSRPRGSCACAGELRTIVAVPGRRSASSPDRVQHAGRPSAARSG